MVVVACCCLHVLHVGLKMLVDTENDVYEDEDEDVDADEEDMDCNCSKIGLNIREATS